ncbi:MAG: heme ABC transporter substrate-binding protein IsdE [Lysinibacillus sp.]
MFKKLLAFATPAVLALMLAACGADEATDTTVSKDKTSTEEPRLITTTSALTDIMAELDLDLVGMPDTSYDIPERYKDLPTVGNAMDPDEEKIMALNSTEVFSVTSLEMDLEEPFAAYGINARFVNLQSIDNMLAAIEEIGTDYDRVKEADALIGDIKEKIEELSASVEGKEKPKVLILFGVPGSYLVSSENSYVGDLVKKAGGENIVQGEDQPEHLASNTEYLHQSNPDVIIRLSHGMPEKVVEMFDEEFETNDIWKHFNAVKNDRVYDLDEPVYGTTANLHVVEALEGLIKILHEEQ